VGLVRILGSPDWQGTPKAAASGLVATVTGMRRVLIIAVSASLAAVAVSLLVMKWAVSVVPWQPSLIDRVFSSVLMVWPSIVLVLGEGKSWTRPSDVIEFVLSVGINAVLYAGLGLLLRAGLRPHLRHLLVVFAAVVGTLWWAAWTIR
jgi:hypothetical protein